MQVFVNTKHGPVLAAGGVGKRKKSHAVNLTNQFSKQTLLDGVANRVGHGVSSTQNASKLPAIAKTVTPDPGEGGNSNRILGGNLSTLSRLANQANRDRDFSSCVRDMYRVQDNDQSQLGRPDRHHFVDY